MRHGSRSPGSHLRARFQRQRADTRPGTCSLPQDCGAVWWRDQRDQPPRGGNLDCSGVSSGAMTNQAQSVLVVDDEPGMRAALVANFQRQGWQADSASGAVEAMRKFEDARFPLVVTDIRMPDGDGLSVMRSVHQTSPSTAVILLTAFGSVPEAVLA